MLFYFLKSILMDPINFRIERTATVRVSVLLFGGLIEQLHFEPTAGVELSKRSRLQGTSLNSSGAKTLQVDQIEKCN